MIKQTLILKYYSLLVSGKCVKGGQSKTSSKGNK